MLDSQNTPPIIPPKLRPRPQSYPAAVKGILISEEELLARITALACVISQDYGNDEVVIVGILTGTIMFLADLTRRLSVPTQIDFVGISSYRDQTRAGQLEMIKKLNLELQNRRVLVVDDILDGGRTLQAVIKDVRSLNPQDLRTCVLLEKTVRRTPPIKADYVGFRIPDYFVVGYGLDYAERYRNLRSIGVLDETQIA
ncbi:MAG: Hypoxanthine-guanine phosphoribosyltransferase [Verrucomicrobia subdivision 3 bacterium]|nr:Hypoxanthine-guanine phosphoribosyltransferase [Limisphaerales bacterium]MCS1417667.1 Hypoxanthine-guanine phosphoribosyltransferase [Limisphaerales bacterium]